MTTPVRNTNNKDFDEILERCLLAIEQGQATVESCTARFPEYKELGPVLRMALAVQGMPRPQMPAAFTAKTRQQLQGHLRAVVKADQQASTPARAARRGWQPLVGLVLAVGIVALVLLGGFGATRASASALPGDTLYPVKRVVENAELLFTGIQTQAERTGVLFHIAQTRLGEMSTLTSRRREITSDFLTDTADSVNRAYLAQPHSAQSDQLINQAEQVIRLAASSGLISAQAADSTASKLVARSTQTLVITNPTLTPGTPGPTPSTPGNLSATAGTPFVIPDQSRTLTSSAVLTLTPTPTFTPTPSETLSGTPTPTATLTASPVVPTNVPPVPASPTAGAALPVGPGQPPLPTVIPATSTGRVPTNVRPTATKATETPLTTSKTPTAAPTEAATAAPTEPATEAVTAEPTQAVTGTATEAATTAATAAITEAATEAATVEPTDTRTPVARRTSTPTRIPRPTRTATLTRTPTNTPTATPPPTITPVPTNTPMPVVDLPPVSFKQPPQVGTFNNCPPEGQGGDAAFNRLRNRTDDGKYQTVGLDTLVNLMWPKEVERKPRDQWPGGASDQVNRADGLPLTVEGFLSQVQQKGPDSQNCQSKDDVNWVLWITPKVKVDAGSALVAQITPRIRANHANWTLDQLKAVVSAGLKVRVSGWLVLDPGQPDDVGKSRGTLWELTPVMQIMVSKDGQQWGKLEDFQP